MLKERHMQFIEANYHLHNPNLLTQRKEAIEREAISKVWIETTPIYQTGPKLQEMEIPGHVKNLLSAFSQKKIGVYDPPYKHQEEALKEFFSNQMDLIVSTGTGSGKTEIFLYSILGQLAEEARKNNTTKIRGIRAIILYPMNALVSDQVSRLRRIFGNKEGANILKNQFGRNIQFGMYTGRTPYHGAYDPVKNDRVIKETIDYFCELKNQDPLLFNDLVARGKVPAKNIVEFRAKNQPKQNQYRTQPGDIELFTRQEMHSPNQYGGVPDILVTNYSMLEYMLLRTIEQPLFDETKKWLDSDETNSIIIVIDEAHLYRGAQGAEVALLLRRLLQRLGINTSRARFILTSASMGGDEASVERGPSFASQLTGKDQSKFRVILGKRRRMENGEPGNIDVAKILSEIKYPLEIQNISDNAIKLGWHSCKINNNSDLRFYLGKVLQEYPIFKFLHEELREEIQTLDDLSKVIFPNVVEQLAQTATLNLILMANDAWTAEDTILLPTRIHQFFKGLPKQYICINPKCPGTEALQDNILGKLYTSPRYFCEHCGSRVFELLSHRTCGAAYIKAYRNPKDPDQKIFLWPESQDLNLQEIQILIEYPRTSIPRAPKKEQKIQKKMRQRYLGVKSGWMIPSKIELEGEQFIEVWIPTEDQISEDGRSLEWKVCPTCGADETTLRDSKVMDLETKGEEIFANLVRTLFQQQLPVKGKEGLPNKGRKVLCFSDSRQKAARLARDLQRTVELDAFKEVIVRVVSKYGIDDMYKLFPGIALYAKQTGIGFFDDEDSVTYENMPGYPGSRSVFKQSLDYIKNDIPELYGIENEIDILDNRDILEDLNNSKRPKQFDSQLLRLLGDKYYSLTASLIGYLEPKNDVIEKINNENGNFQENEIQDILIETIRQACIQRAFDPKISDEQRIRSRASLNFPNGRSRKEGEGIDKKDLIPKSVREILSEVSDDEWSKLSNSLITSRGSVERLFLPSSNKKFLLNPKALRLKIALNDNWFRCTGCWQLFPKSINMFCPDCGGKMEMYDPDKDIHMAARKALFREPCKRILRNEYEPMTMRAEEHSAQLSYKDVSDAFSRTELYELLFQDIQIQNNNNEQPIDVLSSTTTMEVGIDIGSLTAVAMRTIPPRSDNYQQRSGRAGRRSAGLSTIITFADNSPYETYMFNNPSNLILGKGSEPIIYTGNEKICERHINASLFQFFFQRKGGRTGSPERDVFSSLGSADLFFNGSGDYSYNRFKKWLSDEVLLKKSDTLANLCDLLPNELIGSICEPTSDWKWDFVKDVSSRLLEQLDKLSTVKNYSGNSDNEENLLSILLDTSILPAFSFPIDLCKFNVSELKGYNVVTKYEMSEGLTQALSDYIPGRDVVVDKKTYVSYGLHFPFVQDIENRAVGQNLDSPVWINGCFRCNIIIDNPKENLSEKGQVCPLCGELITSQRIFKPIGFSPRSEKGAGPAEGEGNLLDRVNATTAIYPIPVASTDSPIREPSLTYSRAVVTKMPNQKLMVINLGPEEKGFEICKKCGWITEVGAFVSGHDRPYPKNPRSKFAPIQCKSRDSIVTSLGFDFRTDIASLKIYVGSPMNFEYTQPYFNSAARTLANAILLASSRVLSIDSKELAAGYRPLPPGIDTIKPNNTDGQIEIYLYDTTPAGAGFSSSIVDKFEEVLNETRKILSECVCESSCNKCLRTYENRKYHLSLNRQYGLDLLNYITDGIIPDITTKKSNDLVDKILIASRLRNPSIEFFRETDSIFKLRNNGKEVSFTIRPALRKKSVITRESPKEFSDYQVMFMLPGVINELVKCLE